MFGRPPFSMTVFTSFACPSRVGTAVFTLSGAGRQVPLWNSYGTVFGPTLPPKKKHFAQKNDVMALSDHNLPDRHCGALELGPKFCFEPQLSVLDNLALSRSISHLVPNQQSPLCQKTLVSALTQCPGRPWSSGHLSPLVDYSINQSINFYFLWIGGVRD